MIHKYAPPPNPGSTLAPQNRRLANRRRNRTPDLTRLVPPPCPISRVRLGPASENDHRRRKFEMPSRFPCKVNCIAPGVLEDLPSRKETSHSFLLRKAASVCGKLHNGIWIADKAGPIGTRYPKQLSIEKRMPGDGYGIQVLIPPWDSHICHGSY